jgi:SAM-dependent methyltransferase
VSGANASYVRVRSDILDVAVEQDCTRVLDVGCAEGALGAELKRQRPDASVAGIELDPAMAAVAKGRLDQVFVGDAGTILADLVKRGEHFTFIVCGDVLEHLLDPWLALQRIAALKPTSAVVALPNIAHVSTVANLVFRGYWPYRDRGLHDRTHLRFFARNNLPELFESAGFTEVRRITRRRLLEKPHPVNRIAEPVIGILPFVRTLTEYQYISLLKPRK